MNAANSNATHQIRRIRPEDNPAVADIIRQVMTEFGAVGCGYSIGDAEVDDMYLAYPAPASAFFVLEQDGKIQGCGGMGPLVDGEPGVCELRKMYFTADVRGAGLGSRLLEIILDSARQAGYTSCYLETIDSMDKARQLYLKYGFESINKPLGNTGHGSCNHFMKMDL